MLFAPLRGGCDGAGGCASRARIKKRKNSTTTCVPWGSRESAAAQRRGNLFCFVLIFLVSCFFCFVSRNAHSQRQKKKNRSCRRAQNTRMAPIETVEALVLVVIVPTINTAWRRTPLQSSLNTTLPHPPTTTPHNSFHPSSIPALLYAPHAPSLTSPRDLSHRKNTCSAVRVHPGGPLCRTTLMPHSHPMGYAEEIWAKLHGIIPLWPPDLETIATHACSVAFNSPENLIPGLLTSY